MDSSIQTIEEIMANMIEMDDECHMMWPCFEGRKGSIVASCMPRDELQDSSSESQNTVF